MTTSSDSAIKIRHLFDTVNHAVEGTLDRASEIVVTGANDCFRVYVSGQWRCYASGRSTSDFIDRLVKLASNFSRESVKSEQLACVLPDGSRLQYVSGKLCHDGHSQICIRRFNNVQPEFSSFFKQVTAAVQMSDETLDCSCINPESIISLFLSKKTFLVSGGTGSGKTTFTNLLLSQLASRERVVSVSDVAEIILPNDFSVSMISNKALGVSTSDLVVTSLRMFPTRIIVGEIREPTEAVSFVDSVNTGHPGSISTIHANSARLAMDRLSSLYVRSIDGRLDQVKEYINGVVDVVCQLDGKRLVDIYFPGREAV